MSKPEFFQGAPPDYKDRAGYCCINGDLYFTLKKLGFIDADATRQTNVGQSDYSHHFIQPWSIWLDYPNLTPFDHDIIKRVLRNKSSDTRKMDYEKIIHICQERIRQIDAEQEYNDYITKYNMPC